MRNESFVDAATVPGSVVPEAREADTTFEDKILNLVLETFPHIKSAALVKIEEIGQGSFNRVYGITMLYVPME